ncbi:MAG TPA: ABC transporter permease [Thermoanaerobaculia bacterium]|nr:ABC transporter permease [Thermoanaerobaculia bacterium]
MPEWSKEIRELLAPLALSPGREAEVAEELGQHLEDRYEELLARGAREEDARRTALAEIEGSGLAAAIAETLPAQRPAPVPGGDEPTPAPGRLAASVWRDLRHGTRLLRLDPGFALAAVLSLALGIGANTAIFQLLDAVALRPLPVRAPGELAHVKFVGTRTRSGNFSADYPELTSSIWKRIEEQQAAFSRIGAWSSGRLNLAPGGDARYVDALWVSGGFFATLGVEPAVGRLLSPDDDRPGCGSAGLVVSDGFWRRELGGRASVLGTRLAVEGQTFEVIGVTPASFFGVDVGKTFDIALPLCSEPVIYPDRPRTSNPSGWWLAVVGRLKPGWSFERASAQLSTISPGIFEATVPPDYDAALKKRYIANRLGAVAAATGWSGLREDYTSPLTLLLAISGLVLLIACANLANLMLARSAGRQREIAVRLALGASRGRLIRQLLAESLILAALGAACGAAVAQALTRVLVSALNTESSPLFVDLQPDWRVLAFTIVLTAATCILFGLAPAFQATRSEPLEALKSGGRGIAGNLARPGIRRALVVSQVSLSLVLLVGALLFVRTFRNLNRVDPGFRRERVLVSAMDFTGLRIPKESRAEFKYRLLERVRAVPGVASAASARIAPVSGSFWNEEVFVAGLPAANHSANFNCISPGFFRTLQMRLLAGRDFDDTDRKGSPRVAVVTETFARRFFNGANPVGRSFAQKGDGGNLDTVYQVIGLVQDAKYGDLREDFTPIVFTAEAQDEALRPGTRILIQTSEPLAAILPAVTRAVAEVSPQVIIYSRPLQATIAEGLLRERLMANLSGFFGALAAVLAMIGIYSVLSFMVVRRRNEIGVRMALGASRRDIVGMVIREAATLVGIGIAAGALLAVAAATTARTLLYGLQPGDPATLAFAAAALTAVALGSSLVPAWRAAATDPNRTLHEE